MSIIRRILRALGFRVPPRLPLPPALVADIRARKARGETVQTIMQAHDLSVVHVLSALVREPQAPRLQP